MFSMIAARNKKEVIGKNNSLPWGRHTADMFWFRKHTMYRPVIMGRKTFESLGNMKLENRITVVVSSSGNPTANIIEEFPGNRNTAYVTHINSLEAALDAAKDFFYSGWLYEKFGNQALMNNPGNEVMICGGATIYEQAMPFLSRIYLTELSDSSWGDAFLTVCPEDIGYHCVYSQSVEAIPEKDECAATFNVFDNKFVR